MTSSATSRTAPRELDTVVRLVLLNLGLSVVAAVLFAIFHDALLAYQLERLALPATPDVRAGLSYGLWSRVVTVVIIGVVSFLLVRGLRSGKRRSYLRVLVISVIGIAATVYLVVSGQYPLWVDAEQILQGLVLAALLWTITRAPVRQWFARRRPSAGPA